MNPVEKKSFRADLHIHTCLSPCAEWEMTPMKIVDRAKKENLNIIAICDHNSSKNALPVMELGIKANITVLPGLEICTKEEVHLLAIFESLKQAKSVEQVVYQGLTRENNPELFGYQIIADREDMVLGEEEKLLIQASTLTIRQAVDLIHRFKGMAIAAHIDRPSYSILSQLGFIPKDLNLDGVEISAKSYALKQEQHFLDKNIIPCIVSSDAHTLSDIGQGVTVFHMTHPTLGEMVTALKKGDTNIFTRGT